jgi:hypothetical protein
VNKWLAINQIFIGAADPYATSHRSAWTNIMRAFSEIAKLFNWQLNSVSSILSSSRITAECVTQQFPVLHLKYKGIDFSLAHNSAPSSAMARPFLGSLSSIYLGSYLEFNMEDEIIQNTISGILASSKPFDMSKPLIAQQVHSDTVLYALHSVMSSSVPVAGLGSSIEKLSMIVPPTAIFNDSLAKFSLTNLLPPVGDIDFASALPTQPTPTRLVQTPNTTTVLEDGTEQPLPVVGSPSGLDGGSIKEPTGGKFNDTKLAETLENSGAANIQTVAKIAPPILKEDLIEVPPVDGPPEDVPPALTALPLHVSKPSRTRSLFTGTTRRPVRLYNKTSYKSKLSGEMESLLNELNTISYKEKLGPKFYTINELKTIKARTSTQYKPGNQIYHRHNPISGFTEKFRIKDCITKECIPLEQYKGCKYIIQRLKSINGIINSMQHRIFIRPFNGMFRNHSYNIPYDQTLMEFSSGKNIVPSQANYPNMIDYSGVPMYIDSVDSTESSIAHVEHQSYPFIKVNGIWMSYEQNLGQFYGREFQLPCDPRTKHDPMILWITAHLRKVSIPNKNGVRRLKYSSPTKPIIFFIPRKTLSTYLKLFTDNGFTLVDISPSSSYYLVLRTNVGHKRGIYVYSNIYAYEYNIIAVVS